MLKVEDFEQELTRLVAEIPFGSDPWLDDYGQRPPGGSGCSTIITRQVRAFSLYRQHAESGTRFLDWGCRHAWTSCMVRMVNPGAAIEGCDVNESMPENTKNFARMGYTQLRHAWKLPYTDRAFDRIICCGVLEHVPLPNASLAELHRVIETGGYLLITFLPNRFSYTEFISRNVLKTSWHRRLYTKAELKTKLLEHGFEPIEVGFHQVLPSLASGNYSRWLWAAKPIRAMFGLDPIAERLWPLKLFASNLYAIARKCDQL